MTDRGQRKQAFAGKYRRRAAFFALGMLLAAGLFACGKKPSQLDPPSGVENDTFPYVYPDPATDPKP